MPAPTTSFRREPACARALHELASKDSRGRLMTLDTKDDRTVLDRKRVPDSMFTPEAMAAESIR